MGVINGDKELWKFSSSLGAPGGLHGQESLCIDIGCTNQRKPCRLAFVNDPREGNNAAEMGAADDGLKLELEEQ